MLHYNNIVRIQKKILDMLKVSLLEITIFIAHNSFGSPKNLLELLHIDIHLS